MLDGTWDAEGDGATAKITYYVYDDAGNYNVKLTISDVLGGKDDIIHQLVVNAGGSDTDPPKWDGLEGVVDTSGGTDELRVYWGSATDDGSPPVEYLLYYDTSIANLWNTTPLVITSSGSPRFEYILTGLASDEYFAGIRCRDSATPPNEDDNVNTMLVHTL